MTWASMSRALSQRASQKPSRPASKATAMRLIGYPAFAASSRHRCSNFSNALSSTASFLSGWRLTPLFVLRWHLQRGDVIDELALYPQHLAAGRKHRRVPTDAQESFGQICRGADDVLAVVENQQHLFA